MTPPIAPWTCPPLPFRCKRIRASTDAEVSDRFSLPRKVPDLMRTNAIDNDLIESGQQSQTNQGLFE
jgi:hypothetical protein